MGAGWILPQTVPEVTLLAAAERVDVAWRHLIGRRKLGRGRRWYGGPGEEFLASEVCQVCEARWRASCGLRHGACMAGKDRAAHRIAGRPYEPTFEDAPVPGSGRGAPWWMLRQSVPEVTLLALAEQLDVAWSRIRGRLRRGRVRECAFEFTFLCSEICRVCEARWRSGRSPRHGVCMGGLDRASSRYAGAPYRQRFTDTTVIDRWGAQREPSTP